MLLADLLRELQGLPADTLVTFGQGNLSLMRIKNRGPATGPAVMNFEFSELYTITHDPDEE